MGRVRAAAWAAWLAACGGRTPSEERDPLGSAADRAADRAACEALCAETLAACPEAVFDAESCTAHCQAERVFDDCVGECADSCGCVDDCYRGLRLTCGAYCKWVALYECEATDRDACAAACRSDRAFNRCTAACPLAACDCLARCY